MTLFGDHAIAKGFITGAQRDDALKMQSEDPARPLLGQVLLRQGALSIDQLLLLLGDARASAAGPALPSRYRLKHELGRGAMGTVHLADDVTLGRPVAIKILNDHVAKSERVRQRFAAEARLLARLSHPGIVRVHDADPAGFIVMEFVEGRPIDDAVGPHHDLRALASLFVQILDALQHAHERGVIHRDLKPANILVDGDSAKVMDFGLARDLVDAAVLTAPGTLLGTPLYMSPEQVRGANVDARSDVFGAGAVLYRLLTGKPPHGGPTEFDIFAAILARDPDAPRALAPRVPIDLETICLKALRKNAVDRYATAAAFRDDLKRWLTGEAIVASPPSWTDRVVRRVRTHGPKAAVVAVAATAFALGSWVLLQRSEAQRWAREAAEKAQERDFQAAKSLLDRARSRIAIDETLYTRVEGELRAREADARRRDEIDRVFGKVYEWLDTMPANMPNWKAGLSQLDSAIRRMPDVAEAWRRKGDLHGRLGQFDEALDAYERALALVPSPLVHFIRGRVYLDYKGDRAAARREYDAALRLDPTHAYARLAQIRIALMEARPDEAIRLCREAEPHCQAIAQFYSLRGQAAWLPGATREDMVKVVSDFERAASLPDVDAPALLNLAFLKQGRDPAAALAAVDRAIEIQPTYALAWVYRAIAHRAGHDPETAMSDALRALQLNPNLPEALSIHGRLLADRGQAAEAVAAWRKALELGGAAWEKRAQVQKWLEEAEK